MAGRRVAIILLVSTVLLGRLQPVGAQESPESRGDAAASLGRWNEAFIAYLNAVKQLPDRPALADDRRLREKVIKVAGQLAAKPEVPAEARAHVQRADDLLNAETILGPGGGTGTQRAVQELQQGIRLAPWWAEATLKLAQGLQRLQQTDEAIMNLRLYQLADPAGYRTIAGSGATAATAAAETTAPSVGPALIYIYWPPTSRGDGVHPHTLCDGQRMADLGNGHFVAISAAAGNHTIKVKDKTISGSFAGGEEHYIRASLEGTFNPHIDLRFTSKDEATAEIAERKIVVNDQKRTYVLDCKSPAPKKR